MLDVEQPQPALLAEGQGDKTAQLDQFRFGEMQVQPLPASCRTFGIFTGIRPA
jgi:hypothetical protein